MATLTNCSPVKAAQFAIRISKNLWVLLPGFVTFRHSQSRNRPTQSARRTPTPARTSFYNASLTRRLPHAHRAASRARRLQAPRPRRHARLRLRQEVQRKALARRRH